MFRRYTGREIFLDNSVFMSERMTGHRNRAIAHLMLNFDMVGPNIENSLEFTFSSARFSSTAETRNHGCNTCHGGRNPQTGEQAVEQPIRQVLAECHALMRMYDYAGEWGLPIGIPSRAVFRVESWGVPGQFGIGVYSPLLDSKATVFVASKFPRTF